MDKIKNWTKLNIRQNGKLKKIENLAKQKS